MRYVQIQPINQEKLVWTCESMKNLNKKARKILPIPKNIPNFAPEIRKRIFGQFMRFWK